MGILESFGLVRGQSEQYRAGLRASRSFNRRASGLRKSFGGMKKVFSRHQDKFYKGAGKGKFY